MTIKIKEDYFENTVNKISEEVNKLKLLKPIFYKTAKLLNKTFVSISTGTNIP